MAHNGLESFIGSKRCARDSRGAAAVAASRKLLDAAWIGGALRGPEALAGHGSALPEDTDDSNRAFSRAVLTAGEGM
jgi:hypothetical protein